ncbi:MAG: septum formation initiator family protein [Chitinophagales bacterium]|nr:septum formation initiator family protein [Bacteroidota bacterium]MCB9257232.1 septum formation initiator family protein [Chitinophagales bacterium]
MKKYLQKWKELPWYFKNIYFAIFAFFVLWMLFFDSNNLFYQWKLSKKVAELEEQKEYFTKEIEEVDALKDELFSTDEKKEKFARETYFMKKDNEDVFIIVEKD